MVGFENKRAMFACLFISKVSLSRSDGKWAEQTGRITIIEMRPSPITVSTVVPNAGYYE